jgi:uncharacterized membrane protein YfcA
LQVYIRFDFPPETIIDIATVLVVFIVFIATLIRSAFGFGEALIAVPLLAFFIPLKVAAPLAVLVSITIAAIVIVQDWNKIHLRSASWLVLSTIPGIPVGLLLLTFGHQAIVKILLAVTIMAFAGYSLMGRTSFHLSTDKKSWLMGCGLTAGILGGAFGMNGPPLAIYGSMRRWPAQYFRATMQAYFLPASLIGMAGYLIAGLWGYAVTRYYLLSLPGMIPAIFLGRAVNHRLHGDSFLKYVYLGLLIMGAVLMIQSIATIS